MKLTTKEKVMARIEEVKALAPTMCRSEVAAHMGFPEEAFREAMRTNEAKALGIVFYDRNSVMSRLSAETKAEIAALLKSGVTIVEICEKTGLSESTVSRLKYRLGLTKPRVFKNREPVGFAAQRQRRIHQEATLAGEALRESLEKSKLDELIATGGDTTALLEIRAKYGPKVPKPWTLGHLKAMYAAKSFDLVY